MKPVHVGWLNSLYDELRNSCKVSKFTFKNASITEAIDNKEIPDEPPFKHLSE